MVSLHQFLTLYTWFPLAALLLFILLIARFYEKFSGQKTYFKFFILPIILFGGWAVRAASQSSDDMLVGILAAVGGVPLLLLSIRLADLMLRHSVEEKVDSNDS